MQLLGRQSERRVIEELLVQARSGRSGALVVLGEAGIGKTTLLDRVETDAEAEGFTVVRLTGHESEQQLTFAALHRLTAPLLTHIDDLPPPQRTALDVALGRGEGPPPDQFRVGLATLTLLSESAEEQPRLILVDDAQWLDAASARVLAFVARRIGAERLAIVIAMRSAEPIPGDPFADLPTMTIPGLTDAESRALLASTVRTPVDEMLRDRVVGESRGNPLALLELSRATTATQLASALTVPESASAAHRVEELYLRRWEALPPKSRLLMLLASAEPTADPALLWSAAASLGIDVDAAAPAEAADLLEISTTVRFRHPLARSAVYRGSTGPDRRRVHAALGAATDPKVDPDRRAWHRAKAVVGTDEHVAEETAAAADRALRRGAMADAAALLERATELTPDRSVRAQRAVLAANALHEAGASAAALRSLAVAESGPLDDAEKARLNLYRAMISFDMTHAGRATVQMVDAAVALAPTNPAMSRETYLVALNAAVITGATDDGLNVREVAAAAAAHAPRPAGPPAPADLLLDGLVAAYTTGFAEAGPQLRAALAAFRDALDAEPSGEEADRTGRWLALAARTAGAMFDDELTIRLGQRNVERVRESGSLTSLPAALVACGSALALAGDLAGAADIAAQTAAIARATGTPAPPYTDLFLAAWRGRRTDSDRLDEIARDAGDGNGAGPSLVHYALAVSHNATGRYAEAAEEAMRASWSDELVTGSLALPELVEGAARSGQKDAAVEAFERLVSRTSMCATPMALGVVAQANALVADDDSAEAHFEAAIRHLEDTRLTGTLARAHLTFGEWLRRSGHRQRAREHLRTAHESFLRMGAEEFALRAARELRATGEHPRSRAPGQPTALTDQELHIARLVAAGGTSREVAAQLYLSPRTIEAHLRSIFRKLGITSRRQLRELEL
jgi:DNA-binding CsgD family transcriptional regulator